MKTLRRYDIRPATYFITAVTFERQPILLRDSSLFLPSWQLAHPIAWVLLPDHFHALVNCGNLSISEIMHRFKQAYRYAYEKRFAKGRIWQNRFWDHVIRDQDDFRHHLDYIHYNPVLHSIANDVTVYHHSSFSIWLREGYYDEEWGKVEKPKCEGEYGE